MPFDILDDKTYKIKDNKVPTKTITTLIDDALAFDEGRLQTYCKAVFLNYYEIADASIGLRLKEKRQELNKLNTNCNKDIDLFIDKILDNYLLDLKNKRDKNNISNSYKKYQLDINEEIINIIKEIPPIGYDDKYINPTPAKYFFSVMNEYASLDQVKRESIFYKDKIELINNAIKDSKYLRYKLKRKNVYKKFLPIIIETGKSNNFTYVAGISESGHIFSIRLSSIKELTKLEMQKKLSKKEKESFIERSNLYGIEFISHDPITAVIEFSDDGLNLFKKVSSNRPNYTKIDGNTVTFYASIAQIEFYLAQFQEKYKVIEPDILKDDEINTANKILNNYKS